MQHIDQDMYGMEDMDGAEGEYGHEMMDEEDMDDDERRQMMGDSYGMEGSPGDYHDVSYSYLTC